MEHTTTITCPHCSSPDLQKNGHSENGAQRWRYKGCKKGFQLSYSYKAREPRIKEQIDDLELSFHYTAEVDGFWSYMGKKGNQRWTWYAMGKNSGVILAWTNGKRTNKSLEKFLDLLKDTPIAHYHTDDCRAYRRLLTSSIHAIGKDLT